MSSIFTKRTNSGAASDASSNKSVFDHLMEADLTPAQKQQFCHNHGVCASCGTKTHWVGPFRRRPYTNEKVWNGICRLCHPDQCQQQQQQQQHTLEDGTPTTNNPLHQMSRLTKSAVNHTTKLTTTAFQHTSKATTSVFQEASKATSTAFQPLHNKASNALNTVSDGIVAVATGTKRPNSRETTNHPQSTSSTNTNSSMMIDRENRSALASLQSFASDNDSLNQSQQAEVPGQDDKLLLKSHPSSPHRHRRQVSEFFVGKDVMTPYGPGKVIHYRDCDDMYKIELVPNANHDGTIASPRANLFCKKNTFDSIGASTKKRAMAINEAYEALEKMRRLNLEVSCDELGISSVDFDQCTHCLLKDIPTTESKKFPRIRNFMSKNKNIQPCLICAAPSCAAHASPEFRKESITVCVDCVRFFDLEYLVDCLNDAHGAHDDASDQTRQGNVDHILDLYDRVLLLLKFSSQYIESIATALEANTVRYNNINVGGSSAGIVSGALGVAAAAAIFTPAGPPLLVASLLFGTGATAVQSGSEAVNYFSEPNKLADRIIALSAMAMALLRVTDSLREALTAQLLQLEDNHDLGALKQSMDTLRQRNRANALKATNTVARNAILGGVAVGATATVTAESAVVVSGMEMGVLAGRQASLVSKTGTAVAAGARFARFAGGALSAATLLWEANALKNTVKQIRSGHKCEKAAALRAILKELPCLPGTEQLDEECQIYLGAMSNRVNANKLEDAIRLIESKAIEEFQQKKDKDSVASTAVGVSILDGEEEDASIATDMDDLALLESSLKERRLSQSTSQLPSEITVGSSSESVGSNPPTPRMTQSMTLASPASAVPASPSSTKSLSSPGGASSLLQRIQMHKHQDSASSAKKQHELKE